MSRSESAIALGGRALLGPIGSRLNAARVDHVSAIISADPVVTGDALSAMRVREIRRLYELSNRPCEILVIVTNRGRQARSRALYGTTGKTDPAQVLATYQDMLKAATTDLVNELLILGNHFENWNNNAYTLRWPHSR